MITYEKLSTNILDCFVYTRKHIPDHRGFFSELYNDDYDLNCKQINCSFSYKNVFRGIHQATFSKLVSCVKGKIIDFCVDLRPTSSTYLNVYPTELSETNGKQLYIPHNCGHGFLVLEDSVVVYSQDDTYSPDKENTYCYKQFNMLNNQHDLILSSKDSC